MSDLLSPRGDAAVVDRPSNPGSALVRRALADAAPLMIPAVPFGFVVGVVATESAMPTPIAYLSSILVFAGAAQLALISLAGTASLWAAAAAALVINARHVMPQGVTGALRHVGPAVLAALVVSLAAGGTGARAGITAPEAAALVAAVAVAWWRRNLIVTLVAGMAVLWVGTWLA